MTLDEAIKHCQEVAVEQEKLCKVNDLFNISQPKWKECAKEHRQLTEWLKELKQLREQARWIPVSEKLPEIRQHVLCQCRGNNYSVLRLNHDGDWECIYPRTTYMKSFVVAWMPLPEPYKPESEVQDAVSN